MQLLFYIQDKIILQIVPSMILSTLKALSKMKASKTETLSVHLRVNLFERPHRRSDVNSPPAALHVRSAQTPSRSECAVGAVLLCLIEFESLQQLHCPTFSAWENEIKFITVWYTSTYIHFLFVLGCKSKHNICRLRRP